MNKYYKNMIDIIRKRRAKSFKVGMSDINVINDKISKLHDMLKDNNLDKVERRNCIIYLDRLYKIKEQVELSAYNKRNGKIEPEPLYYKTDELSPLDKSCVIKAQNSYYEGLISYKEYINIIDNLKRRNSNGL